MSIAESDKKVKKEFDLFKLEMRQSYPKKKQNESDNKSISAVSGSVIESAHRVS